MNEMASPLLRGFDGVLALPSARFSVDARETEGLIWDPAPERIVAEALPTLFTYPPQDALRWDDAGLRSAARQAGVEAETLAAPAIFGGCLIRHFGHFLHESLSRLWWLAPLADLEGPAKEAALRLQQLEGDVVFFMPRWLDEGKTLLPYMEEILGLLHLPASRIRILQRPLRFRELWIPACVWGFGSDARAVDRQLGCDSRALLRHLLASSQRPASPAPQPAATAKLYVSRSGLPISLGRLLGDVVLDPLLEAAGYTVFHPERSSIAEQIRLYGQASDLIFMDGSSLYLLWLAKLRPGTRVRLILRRQQGRWMSEKVLELLPGAAHIRWEIIDALQGEALTSPNDWESHNVADLAALLRQLGIEAPAELPKPAEEALAAYSHTLLEQSSPEQLARVLQALLTSLATDPRRPPSRRDRLYRKVRRLLAARQR